MHFVTEKKSLSLDKLFKVKIRLESLERYP